MELTADAFRRPEPKAEVVQLEEHQGPTLELTAESTNLVPIVDVPDAIRIPLALRPFITTSDFKPAKLTNRTELMAVLGNQLPKNEYGLPLILYRPDLLDYNQFNDVEENQEQIHGLQEHLDNAVLPLSYYEGYPALPDGKPLWDSFEFESVLDHSLFQQYLELPGARQLGLLVTPHTSLQTIQALFHTYFWSLRAQASDQFAVAHQQRLREQRLLKMEDNQFLQAQTIIDKMQEHFTSIDWKALALEPEKFVKTLGALYEMQRKAVRATGAKDDESKLAQPTEVIMRKLTTIQKTDVNGNEIPIEDQGLSISQILRAAGNNQSVAQLQELILKIGTDQRS